MYEIYSKSFRRQSSFALLRFRVYSCRGWVLFLLVLQTGEARDEPPMYENKNTHIRHKDLDFFSGMSRFPSHSIHIGLSSLQWNAISIHGVRFGSTDLSFRCVLRDRVGETEVEKEMAGNAREQRRKINYKIISKIIEMLVGATPFPINVKELWVFFCMQTSERARHCWVLGTFAPPATKCHLSLEAIIFRWVIK